MSVRGIVCDEIIESSTPLLTYSSSCITRFIIQMALYYSNGVIYYDVFW